MSTRRPLRAVGRMCGLCCGLVLALVALAGQAQTQELTEARATVTVGGQTTRTAVHLPYHWDRLHKSDAGEAVFEIPFAVPDNGKTPQGVYLPRIGNAYEVWFNDTLIQHNGDMQTYNGADYAKSPRYMSVPAELLRNDNMLRVHIRADLGRRAGLAAPVVGPEEKVYALYLRNFRAQNMGALAVLILSLLVGLMALALWATQVDATAQGRRGRDPLYLMAGVAELCWSVSVANFIVEEPPLPWPWWGMVATFATAVWACSMALFCVEVAGWRRRAAVTWLRRWLAGLLVACAVAVVAGLVYGYAEVLTLWFVAFALTFMVFVAYFLWSARGGAPLPHKIVALAVMLNTLVGLYDLYVLRFSTGYADNTYLRYSSVMFGMVLLVIVLMRFRSASGLAHDLLANMAARVAAKEQELAQSYQRLELLAREQERTSERARILRDMHDGVGSHISSAIRQLESGRATPEQVLHTLRDSLDQLKLSIDTMHLPTGDITALLANLRYRLEPRFKALDIELQWDVDLLAPMQRLDDKAMRHLQYMVFEAISNVLQHAHASVLRIELRAASAGEPDSGSDAAVRLRVMDNGRGFDPERVKLAGLRSLRERAAIIGAQLHIASVPGHTTVDIVL